MFLKRRRDVFSCIYGETTDEMSGRFTANITRCFCKTSGCFHQQRVFFFPTRRRDTLSCVVATEVDDFDETLLTQFVVTKTGIFITM